MNQPIGHKIRDIRKAKGLTQESLAQELQVARATVNKWENGHDLYVSNLFKIAELTTTPIHYFLSSHAEAQTIETLAKLVSQKEDQMSEYKKFHNFFQKIDVNILERTHLMAIIIKILEVPENLTSLLEEKVMEVLSVKHTEDILKAGHKVEKQKKA